MTLSIADLPVLKAKVREHGRYRELAEATGLSESWLAKFASQPGDNYTLKSVQTIVDYFDGDGDQTEERTAA